MPERVKFKLVLMVHNCLHHKAPRHLMDYYIPISDVASRRHLRSGSVRRHYLVVPRHSLSSYGRRAFAVVGPTAWNSLSDDLRDLTLSTDSFRRLLKTRLFSEYLHTYRLYSALEVSHFVRYISSRLKPNTHRRRRRDSTRQLSRVGVGGVYWALLVYLLLHEAQRAYRVVLTPSVLHRCKNVLEKNLKKR